MSWSRKTTGNTYEVGKSHDGLNPIQEINGSTDPFQLISPGPGIALNDGPPITNGNHTISNTGVLTINNVNGNITLTTTNDFYNHGIEYTTSPGQINITNTGITTMIGPFGGPINGRVTVATLNDDNNNGLAIATDSNINELFIKNTGVTTLNPSGVSFAQNDILDYLIQLGLDFVSGDTITGNIDFGGFGISTFRLNPDFYDYEEEEWTPAAAAFWILLGYTGTPISPFPGPNTLFYINDIQDFDEGLGIEINRIPSYPLPGDVGVFPLPQGKIQVSNTGVIVLNDLTMDPSGVFDGEVTITGQNPASGSTPISITVTNTQPNKIYLSNPNVWTINNLKGDTTNKNITLRASTTLPSITVANTSPNLIVLSNPNIWSINNLKGDTTNKNVTLKASDSQPSITVTSTGTDTITLENPNVWKVNGRTGGTSHNVIIASPDDTLTIQSQDFGLFSQVSAINPNILKINSMIGPRPGVGVTNPGNVDIKSTDNSLTFTNSNNTVDIKNPKIWTVKGTTGDSTNHNVDLKSSDNSLTVTLSGTDVDFKNPKIWTVNNSTGDANHNVRIYSSNTSLDIFGGPGEVNIQNQNIWTVNGSAGDTTNHNVDMKSSDNSLTIARVGNDVDFKNPKIWTVNNSTGDANHNVRIYSSNDSLDIFGGPGEVNIQNQNIWSINGSIGDTTNHNVDLINTDNSITITKVGNNVKIENPNIWTVNGFDGGTTGEVSISAGSGITIVNTVNTVTISVATSLPKTEFPDGFEIPDVFDMVDGLPKWSVFSAFAAGAGFAGEAAFSALALFSGPVTYEPGSFVTYNTGSTLTFQTGTSTTFSFGSTVTNSGTTINSSTSNITYQSGAGIVFNTGSTISNSSTTTNTSTSTTINQSGSIITNSGTVNNTSSSITTYASGSTTTYASGSNITYASGSNVNFAAGAVVNMGDVTFTKNVAGIYSTPFTNTNTGSGASTQIQLKTSQIAPQTLTIRQTGVTGSQLASIDTTAPSIQLQTITHSLALAPTELHSTANFRAPNITSYEVTGFTGGSFYTAKNTNNNEIKFGIDTGTGIGNKYGRIETDSTTTGIVLNTAGPNNQIVLNTNSTTKMIVADSGVYIRQLYTDAAFSSPGLAGELLVSNGAGFGMSWVAPGNALNPYVTIVANIPTTLVVSSQKNLNASGAAGLQTINDLNETTTMLTTGSTHSTRLSRSGYLITSAQNGLFVNSDNSASALTFQINGINQLRCTSTGVQIPRSLIDSFGSSGTPGQVLRSDAAGVKWGPPTYSQQLTFVPPYATNSIQNTQYSFYICTLSQATPKFTAITWVVSDPYITVTPDQTFVSQKTRLTWSAWFSITVSQTVNGEDWTVPIPRAAVSAYAGSWNGSGVYNNNTKTPLNGAIIANATSITIPMAQLNGWANHTGSRVVELYINMNYSSI